MFGRTLERIELARTHTDHEVRILRVYPFASKVMRKHPGANAICLCESVSYNCLMRFALLCCSPGLLHLHAERAGFSVISALFNATSR